MKVEKENAVVRLSKKIPQMAKMRGWEKVSLKKRCVDKLYGKILS